MGAGRVGAEGEEDCLRSAGETKMGVETVEQWSVVWAMNVAGPLYRQR
jgi:hypothetical protein